MKIEDLINIFASKYNKKIVITGLRCKEKINEDLISESEAKMTYICGNYYHIGIVNTNTDIKPFNSSMKIIDKTNLEKYINEKNLL